VRATADGPDIDTTPPELARAYTAWEAAFEMFRNHMVI
jgi:hypothetical protein